MHIWQVQLLLYYKYDKTDCCRQLILVPRDQACVLMCNQTAMKQQEDVAGHSAFMPVSHRAYGLYGQVTVETVGWPGAWPC